MAFSFSSLWDTLTKPKKKTPTPQTFTGAVGGTTAKATPSLWERITPWQESAGETLWGEVKERLPWERQAPVAPTQPTAPAPTPFQPMRLPQQTPIQPFQTAPQAPPSPLQGLTDTINNWLRGGQDVVGQIGQAAQQPGPFGAAPVGAAPGQEPTMPPGPTQPPEEPGPANLWQGLTPWKEEAGETFGGEVSERWQALTQPKPTTVPQPTVGGAGLGETTAPQVDPRVDLNKASEYWRSLTEPVQTEEQRLGGKVLDNPQVVNWLRTQGYSAQEIANMTLGQAEEIEDAFQRQQSLEQAQEQAGVSRDVWADPEAEAQRQRTYEETQARGREGYFTPEQEAHRQRQAEEQAARERQMWGSPEQTAQRQKSYEESQRRQQEWYWSGEQVANREKQRDEQRESAQKHELRGWDTYFDFLDDLQLSPAENDYWDDPGRLRELRDKWEAAGKKASWMTYLREYDFKTEFAEKTYRERQATAARYAPRQRGVSF